MWSIFEVDSTFYRMIEKIMQIVLLNILWVLCCLPIITIGTSTTALYYVTMKMVREEENYVIKDFFRSFRRNLRQGIPMMLIISGIGFVFLQDYRYFEYLGSLIGKVGSTIVLILYGLVVTMVFPVLAKFDNSIRNTLKTSVFFAFRYLGSSIAIFIMVGIVAYGFYSSAVIMLIVFICGGATMAYGSSFLLRNIFDQYIKKENEHEEER